MRELLEKLRDAASAELTDIGRHPRLDPERVFRIYKKLGISSVEALKEKLASGDIEKTLGRLFERRDIQRIFGKALPG